MTPFFSHNTRNKSIVAAVVVVSTILLIGIFHSKDIYSSHADRRYNEFERRMLAAPSRPQLQHVVDGLRNEDVVMVVASTGKDTGKYLRDRIIPSARTWMRLLTNVFVVIEDTVDMRFALRHCTVSEHKDMTAFACPREPTYILTRVCTNEYYNAPGICCKFDETINFIANTNHRLYRHMKYLIQCDDDTFWRSDQLLRWLAVVDKSGFSEFPLVGNVDDSKNFSNPRERRVGGIFHIKGCDDVYSNGWYQPIMLNKAAVEQMRMSTAEYATTQVCKSFVLSQDAGIGVFAWIHRLYHIKMPGVVINGNHLGSDIFKPDQMAVHAIRHVKEDDCEMKSKEWLPSLRYDQQVVVGCGKVGFKPPLHDAKRQADMYDAFEWFAENGTDIELERVGVNDFKKAVDKEGTVKIVPYISRLPGYENTEHSKKHNVAEKWAPFGPLDCKIPGKVE